MGNTHHFNGTVVVSSTMFWHLVQFIHLLRREGEGSRGKKLDLFCFDIFDYLSYVGSGTFYRNEKSSLVVEQ